MSDLLVAAQRLLERNTRIAERDGCAYRFTIPAPHSYPFQWFWDSCFHAIAWARLDRERAADELRALLAWQRPDGMIPHVVFWDPSHVQLRKFWHYVESRGIPLLRRPLTTECVQPPVLAQALELVGGAFAGEALPAVAGFYRHLGRARDPDGDRLVSIVNRFESGLDYSPVHDDGQRHADPLTLFLRSRRGELVNKALGFDLRRIFRLTDHHQEDVLFNAVYADGLAALARLAAEREPELARWARTAARRVTDALLERCWDERCGLFVNLRGRGEEPTRQRAITSLMPLLLADLPRDVAARLVEHLCDRRSFWTPFPVASVPRDDPHFSRDSHLWGFRFIWRGPVSVNTNWLLVQGLLRHGYAREAGELAAGTQELVERSGFNEFYDPIDGTAVGAHDFGWATLAATL